MDLRSGYPFSLLRYGLPFHYPKLTSPARTEVAIIGGGVSGALTAHYLVGAGMNCMVLDGRTIGLGSTCASTSLLQYEIDVRLTDLAQRIGINDAVRAYHLCRDAVHTLQDIAKRVGLKSFKLNRSLYYAVKNGHVGPLREEYALRKKYGLALDYLDARDVRDRFRFDAPAALLSRDGAYADAYLLTHALLQHGIQKGLRVYDRTFVERAVPSKTGVRLTTAEGISVHAKKVIYATGYESREVLGEKFVKLQSTYVTISENMQTPHPVLDDDVMIWNTGTPYLYMRKTDDNRIIVGGRDENFYSPARRDKLIKRKSAQLVRDFGKLFPETRFDSEFSWTGTFATTGDGLPFIGTHPKFPHGYFALGFGGNGITFSVMAARIIRDLLTGRKNADARIFSFGRASG